MTQPPTVSGPGTTTILLVDDEEMLRETGRRVLERLGYRVLLAGDGETALALVEGGTAIDLVILDVHLPGIGGLEVARRLRERPDAPRLLIASGSHASELPLEGLPFLEKPWDIEDLRATLRRLLADRAPRA